MLQAMTKRGILSRKAPGRGSTISNIVHTPFKNRLNHLKPVFFEIRAKKMEAWIGVEPIYAILQTAA